MKKTWAGIEYTTEVESDNAGGSIALRLHRSARGSVVTAARVVYWDAAGQFFLEMSVDELPVDIVEELIAEAKRTIQVK